MSLDFFVFNCGYTGSLWCAGFLWLLRMEQQLSLFALECMGSVGAAGGHHCPAACEILVL